MAKRNHSFSWEKLDAVLQLGASKPMAASVMDCSEDTIDRRIKSTFKTTFSAYRESKLSVTKVKLQQKAIKMGLDGNATMLIFCLKNLCGWQDKIEQQHSGEATFKLNYSIEDDKE